MHIIAAAIKTEDGIIFSGKRHQELIPKAIRAGSENYLEGFLTNDGNFVTREEAAEIAFNAGQIEVKLLRLKSQNICLKL